MSTELHERRAALRAETLDDKRAIDSMKEELEAIDWYRQRAEAAADPALRAVLEHHRDEEVEHFVMLLEWLRRRDPVVARHLATYLGSQGEITAIERGDNVDTPAATTPSRERVAAPAAAPLRDRRVTIGSLKEKP
jgi:hypothetical protein